MTNIKPNILPKEKHMRTERIRNISQFIQRVNEYMKARGQKDGTVVYRGEPDIYPEPCRPNIFRRGVMNGNRFFEISCILLVGRMDCQEDSPQGHGRVNRKRVILL